MERVNRPATILPPHYSTVSTGSTVRFKNLRCLPIRWMWHYWRLQTSCKSITCDVWLLKAINEFAYKYLTTNLIKFYVSLLKIKICFCSPTHYDSINTTLLFYWRWRFLQPGATIVEFLSSSVHRRIWICYTFLSQNSLVCTAGFLHTSSFI